MLRKIGMISIFFLFSGICLFANDLDDIRVWQYVDFDRSMKVTQFPKSLRQTQVVFGSAGKHYYNFFKDLYNRNNLTQLRKKGIVLEEKIPKIIHQIWIGSPLPEAFKELCQSWKFYHNSRGWLYKLWTDDDIDSLNLYNRNFFDATKKPGIRSDLMRYEIIHKFGGFYLDVDFECLQPLDDLCVYDFVTALQPLDAYFVQLGLAFYGARPGHPILEHCIKTVKDDWRLKTTVYKTGPIHFTKSFVAMAGKSGNVDIALPATYFYPLGALQKEYDYQAWIDGGAYAVHHWAKSWLPVQVRSERFKELHNDELTKEYDA